MWPKKQGRYCPHCGLISGPGEKCWCEHERESRRQINEAMRIAILEDDALDNAGRMYGPADLARRFAHVPGLRLMGEAAQRMLARMEDEGGRDDS